jgi:hypothetical protein
MTRSPLAFRSQAAEPNIQRVTWLASKVLTRLVSFNVLVRLVLVLVGREPNVRRW